MKLLNNLVVIFLASEVCKGAHRYNEYSAIQGQSRLMGNVYNLYRV
jgi:hypothetical protein